MKKIILTYACLIALATLPGKLRCQDAPRERISTCTDRTLYVAGEKIYFSASVRGLPGTIPGRIYYCELVNPEGKSVAGGKFLSENISGGDCLKIPEATLTGMYYLKTYTRAMRNGSPADYHYTLLKIIHPDNTEIMSMGKNGAHDPATVEKADTPGGTMGLSLKTEKESYHPGEKIVITIEGTANDAHQKHCLSVVPGKAWERYDIFPAASGAANGNGVFYPESRGVSLSGNVVDEHTGERLAGVKVNLSLLGEKDMMAVMSDSSGRFFFALPDLTGSRDIFLSAASLDGRTVVINIDNDFCTRPVHLPHPEFSLDREEQETALEMIRNHKVARAFAVESTPAAMQNDLPEKSFYGEPTQVLLIDKYIELPTLEEYFNELPLAVKVRTSRGRKHFRFNSYQAEMTIYDPLVLIDWVAVENMEDILSTNPREIDRIELVNAPYVKGNVTYGGIISLVSKNNDFAGIDLPSSGTFIHYQLLKDCAPDIIRNDPPRDMPDARNTACWVPGLELDREGKASVSFTAPETTGRYVIVLRELDNGAETRGTFDVIK